MKILSLVLICLTIQATSVAQQPGMVEKKGGGMYFDAEKYKVDRMKMQTSTKPGQPPPPAPTEYDKPKNGVKSNGEIWIDGYCRYRPAQYSTSHYSDMSETDYLQAAYPKDTIRYSDNFSGTGNIPWSEMKSVFKNDPEFKDLSQQLNSQLNDGIPMPLFLKLMRSTSFFQPKELGGKYQFSRAYKIWIKRISGSEKTNIEIRTQYNVTNGDDGTIVKINDTGKFEISDLCNNCKHTSNDLKSGKVKSWVEGGWNEVTISKDQFNTVRVYLNDEMVLQYQQPYIPIATRYASFYIDLPRDSEKKNLVYHVGQITVESYPK